ncbi:hypothetical protein F0241_07035 [Vibrio kanaloae]|uniref:hypothetical protein n=1 Tax=Vibrio TaxID=662 RepID=UPI00148CA652|nr:MULTISPECIES: hypothetical protein [Vibrio]MDH5897029.1 hypothetical protein [Vibrio splendidus]NOI00862.1 hypothetical protein [Vibrio kanaloae]
MKQNQMLTIEVDEDHLFGEIYKRKISVKELGEFMRMLSVGYSIAQYLDIKENKGFDVNIDSCVQQLFSDKTDVYLPVDESWHIVDSSRFLSSIDRQYDFYISQLPLDHHLEIVSINYNSPLKISITGKSIRNLVIAVAIMGGEVNINELSVKMPGIAEMVSKFASTYIEIQKYRNSDQEIAKPLESFMNTLPHKDVNDFNKLRGGDYNEPL